MKHVVATITTIILATLLLASAPAFAGDVTVLAETDYGHGGK